MKTADPWGRYGVIFLLFLTFALLAWSSGAPVRAQSSPVALAYPIKNITIDGDLSDWPEGLTSYPIAMRFLRGEPDGAADLSGSFRVGYDPTSNAILLAVEVNDDKLIVQSNERNVLDKCAVFLQLQNDQHERGYWQFGCEGKDRWFRSPTNLFRRPIQFAEVVMEPTRTGAHYEWRISVEEITAGKLRLQFGRVVGFDVELTDVDHPAPRIPADSPAQGHYGELFHDSATLRWVTQPWGGYPWYQVGKLVLVQDGMATSRLEGMVAFRDGRALRREVVVESEGIKEFQLTVSTDQTGRFQLDLPSGGYRLSLPNQKDSRYSRIRLEPGREHRLDLLADDPKEQTVPAGSGRTVRAGRGTVWGGWRQFTVKDGLPSNRIKCVLEDREGNLWFGTDGEGAVRFDGATFQTFTTEDGLAHDRISCITEDSQGNLWFGTGSLPISESGNGVCYFDGQSFTKFTTESGLPGGDPVFSIQQDEDEVLWFSGDRFSRYDTGTKTVSLSKDYFGTPAQVRFLRRDTSGRLWCGSSGGLWLYEKGSFVRMGDEVPGFGSSVNAMVEDSNGILWFGYGGLGALGGLARYDGDSFELFDTRHHPSLRMGISMIQAPGGDLLIGGENCLLRFDGNRFQEIPLMKDKYVERLHDLLIDRTGNLWVCTGFEGVLMKEGSELMAFPQRKVMLRDRQGRVWFYNVQEDRLEWLDQNDEFVESLEIDGHQVRLMAETNNGEFWLALEKKRNGFLWSFDGERRGRVLNVEEFIGKGTEGMVVDPRGTLWVASWKGLLRLDEVKAEVILEITSNECLLADRQQNLWIGNWKGLHRLSDSGMKHFTRQDGLPSNRIMTLAEGEDCIWIGTDGGLSRFDGEKFVNFTMADGLPSGQISYVVPSHTRKGHLWIGTLGGGLCHFDGLVFQSVSKALGRMHDTVERILEEEDGTLWIGMPKVSYRYRPDLTPPKVRITRITAGRDYSGLEDLQLTGKQPQVRFEFEGMSFKTHPDDMAYVYRLVGFHKDWRPVYEGEMEYRDLPIGDYIFEVKAVDRDLNYSTQAATVRLNVQPAYGQIALIGGMGVAAFGALVASGFAIKHRRERNRSLVREKEAAESANRAKSAFLANMSHEIRTPMNAILGYAQLMGRSKTLTESDRRSVQTIQKSGDHLLSMINDILDLSKIEAGRLELDKREFDLKELLEGLEVMFCHRCEKKELEFKVELAEPALRVLGDEGKLRQVLINLLGNAMKFTEQGRVTLRVSRSQGMELQDGRCRYRFEVIDTGPGIPKEEGSEILKPFAQGHGRKHEGGTGLGLAISRRLIELMGGVLNLESDLGEGSRFWFEIPLKESTKDGGVTELEQWKGQEEVVEVAVRRLKQGYRVRALVVDDVPENRDVLSHMLRETGCDAETAEGGEQALKRFRKQQFDIVFLDIRMPGMDGMETLKRIQSELQHLKSGNQEGGVFKVVAVSASVLIHQRQRYLEAGFDAFIGKPFRFEEIYRCLSKLLGVKFEMDSTGDAVSEHGWADLDALRISQEMKQRLRSAAEDGSATRLSQCISELETGGGMEKQLARILKPLAQEFNMEEILEVMEKLGSSS